MNSHFIVETASSFTEARFLPKKLHVSGLQYEKSSSYVVVSNYLLTTYVTNNIFVHAIKVLGSQKQAPNVSATLYAKRLYTRTLYRGIVYKERSAKIILVKGWIDSLCDNKCDYLEWRLRAAFTQLALYPDMLIKIGDRSVKASKSSKEKPSWSSVYLSRSCTFAVV